MDVGAITPANQIAWRQVAEERYQKLMENTQREERRQAVQNLQSKLYIAKNGRVEVQIASTRQNIDLLA
tara:strand:+ start:430 stop:636 length:207 start_codon:yes stop_codon:yes gene_type:complete